MKISVLGCGRWGSFLAWYTDKIGNDVISYGYDDDIYKDLAKTRKNEYVSYPDSIVITNDLKKAIDHAEVIIISISSQGLRGFLASVTKHDLKDKKIVLCMKGIEEGTGKRLTEVSIECGIDKNNLAVWVGPGHIQDFTKGIPNCMVIDSYNKDLTTFLADNLKSDLIRFYYGKDIIGTEVGSATKNIMGIVAGVLDGLNYGSLKGPLMARGSREVARLIKALGGEELSAYGLCHLGDYETTLFSCHSHNRAFGECYVKGESFGKLAEGVATARAIMDIAKRLNIDLPITQAVNSMMSKELSPKDLLKNMFLRDSKTEFYV